MNASLTGIAALIAVIFLGLAGCGQKGPLKQPQKNNAVFSSAQLLDTQFIDTQV